MREREGEQSMSSQENKREVIIENENQQEIESEKERNFSSNI